MLGLVPLPIDSSSPVTPLLLSYWQTLPSFGHSVCQAWCKNRGNGHSKRDGRAQVRTHALTHRSRHCTVVMLHVVTLSLIHERHQFSLTCGSLTCSRLIHVSHSQQMMTTLKEIFEGEKSETSALCLSPLASLGQRRRRTDLDNLKRRS